MVRWDASIARRHEKAGYCVHPRTVICECAPVSVGNALQLLKINKLWYRWRDPCNFTRKMRISSQCIDPVVKFKPLSVVHLMVHQHVYSPGPVKKSDCSLLE